MLENKSFKMVLLLFCFCYLSGCNKQNKTSINTNDINNFWTAYDSLSKASNNKDSVSIIQRLYIDKASNDFKSFIKSRNLTSDKFIKVIGQYPKFWKSIRPLTEKIENRKSGIEDILNKLEKELPDFQRPNICFAIGCLSSGGTTDNNLILVGAEIASADSSTDKSELSNWLQSSMGRTGEIGPLVAHEAVHTQQKNGFSLSGFIGNIKNGKPTLLNNCIAEGSATFIQTIITKSEVGDTKIAYGEAHFCPLLNEFLSDVDKAPYDYTKWLYQGDEIKDRPADLGYYIGYKITEAFYESQQDKKKALRIILNKSKYDYVLHESNVSKKCR